MNDIVLFFLSCLFVVGCQQTADKKASPNFIILLADDLGYGDLSCYGHPTIQTPNLDQMAREGVRLTQFYMAASLCTPSRTGLLTGRLPIRSGMCGKRGVLFPDSAGGLPASETTIAEALKKLNYTSAYIGKWHLGHLPEYLPTQHGFDYYFGIPYSNDMSPEQNNWDYAKAAFPPTPLIENETILEYEPDQSLLTKRYTQRAKAFIRENKEQPFFLYLAHTFPHTPLYVDDQNEGRSRRGLYGDVVEVVDWSVGEIIGLLKELDLQESTFLLFTSDNGPWGWAGINGGSAGLLKGKKGSPWEGGFRVPTIAWMPGHIPADQVNYSIGTAMDLFPTMLNLAGEKDLSEYAFDGKNIWPSLAEDIDVQDEVYYYSNTELVAFRDKEWKLFIKDPNPWNDEFTEEDLPLLYNINWDPSEQFNVAKDYPKIVANLKSKIERHLTELNAPPSELAKIHPDYHEVYQKFNK